LDRQAFPKVPRSDAGRVELLDFAQHRLDPLQRQAGGFRQLAGRHVQQPVVVQAADQQFGDFPVAGIEVRQRQLPQHVVLQRLLARQGIEQPLMPLLLLLDRAVGAGPRPSVEFPPGIVQLREPSNVLVSAALVRDRRRQFDLDRLVRLHPLLQHRVLLELLPQQGLKLEQRRLENLQRLPELRRQDLLESLLLRLRERRLVNMCRHAVTIRPAVGANNVTAEPAV